MTNKILSKIESLDKKLDKVEKIEEHLEGLVEKENKEVQEIIEEEHKIERALVKVGDFTIKRKHLLELARGAAGAFLGVGLGQALGDSVALAQSLPWINIIGILLFIFVLAGLLIYKNDRQQIKGTGRNASFYVFQKLWQLYLISVVVQLLGLILFNNFPGWNETLIKALIIGSYLAMSSAVAFTLI